jgi:hypothetical protein
MAVYVVDFGLALGNNGGAGRCLMMRIDLVLDDRVHMI